jgi:hypothetical protein
MLLVPQFCYQSSCFPHVVNIAVQTILKELKDNPYDPVIQSSTTPSADLIEYAEALRTKPVSTARSIVAICRKSGSRRTELRNTIVEGIRDGTWPHLPVVQLLRDCVTRWSSTYNMIDRCIKLYPVCFIRRYTWQHLITLTAGDQPFFQQAFLSGAYPSVVQAQGIPGFA